MDYREITTKLAAICRETGAFILAESENFNKGKVEYKKGFSDMVSYVDKEAERKLVEALGVLVPGSGFIAEEGTGKKVEGGFNWIIDPLDGTTNFIHKLPVFAVSVALIKGDDLVAGVVYEINRDECFYAWKGGGAFCNDRPIAVSEVTKLEDSLLATGFPYYDFNYMDKYLKILDVLMKKTHGLRRMGSAAVDLVYTACGRFEGFFEYNLNAWDVAAGVLIIQEAGGIVTDFKGESDFLFGRELIAGGAVQPLMLEEIKRYWES